MSVTGPFSHPTNLNPTAPEFLPATNLNPNPIPFFIPTRIYFPLPPPPPPPPSYPSFFHLPPPHLLPPTSVAPTRALMLLPVPGNVTESSIRQDMELFGEVRGVQMERADEGIVTVHFYNLRTSQIAFNEIRYRHMQHQLHFTAARGLVFNQPVWAHFVFPQLNAVPDGNNQGTLVVMNLEPTVSSTTLRHIFQAYGEVKQVRETPYKREQRFVEFFDVRDAARALREMDGKHISGKPMFIQFSRPGGLTKKLFLASRFHKNFTFDNNHYHPAPPPPMVKSNNQMCEQKQRNNNNKKKKKQKKHMKKSFCDPRFVIMENTIAAGEVRDRRTTVMIKNIPNKYTQKLFLKMLDTHCNECNQKVIKEGNKTPMSSYDFVYLPIDFSNKCNVGYGFVNMTSPEAVLRLYKTFHNQHWGVFNTRKICEVTYARIQGLESLKEHFKNARLPGVEMEHNKYMPVLFSPPRDGGLLTEPMVIVDETGVSDKEKVGSDGCCCLGERIESGGV
ncbi:PREDICTED: LOW QUALITY PROTEIN: protein terminal ear1 homolog [Camelina sativa]|uniref:LOW QUALITY PROTEIN: protein terminal ear1 homolog n=1 Tax=Camelina sativa TaxID=90675 RepID=A0ABM0Z820_CAMSA|nr:PREDICTED: LOW QUALITY PROTEIN: protein terminal ear1 homolog [Camelina sativa]